ncbi:uncharacterized protein IL334_005619 [Kwoniella shivajii]|uniref:Uncharacterized protein n=1 Tax=Kwoniella shivajii TaxID=564305 RepID=A0ABZ1D422_9TREE|nr:hypothetical protein IL334_005619 [Kwoniella shivajii]
MTPVSNEAGPSVPRSQSLPHPHACKPKSAHPSNPKSTNKRKLPPSLPPKPKTSSHPSASIHPNGKAPTLPLKTLQGVSKIRSDSTKDGIGRESIFVTRKTGLGMLLGKCRSLVVDEGYTRLRFHAIGAAIPQSFLLLHALLDLLPYPVGEKGMWYEIRTGSIECIDEISNSTNVSGKGNDGKEKEGDKEDWLNDIGGIEEDVPERKSRVKSTVQIDLHMSPRPKSKKIQSERVNDEPHNAEKKKSNRNRPSKKKREQLATKRKPAADESGIDEEEMMNIQESEEVKSVKSIANTTGDIMVISDEEEEEIEEIEM